MSLLKAALAALIAAAVLAGCTGHEESRGEGATGAATGAGATSPTIESSAPGVKATVVQQRLDEGTRRISLELTTDKHTSMHVSGVRLLSDAFAAQPITDWDIDYSPGRTIDLFVNYGTPICTPGTTPRDARVLVRYSAEGGDRTITVPVARVGRQELRDLQAAGCAEQRLAAAAGLTYRTPFHRARVDGRTSLVGALQLKRPATGGSGEPVVIDSVLGSVLFELVGHAPGDHVGSLPRGQRSATIPVLIRGNDRCDAHSRSASQQTFLFTADVRVGDAPVHREIIEPPTSLQVQANALLDDVCR